MSNVYFLYTVGVAPRFRFIKEEGEMSPLKFRAPKLTRIHEQACIVNSMAFMGVGRKRGSFF